MALIQSVDKVSDLRMGHDICLQEMPVPFPPVWIIPIPQEIRMTVKPSATPEDIELKTKRYILHRTPERTYYLLERNEAMKSMNKMLKALSDFEAAFNEWAQQSYIELEANGKGWYNAGTLQFQTDVNIPAYFNDLAKSVQRSKDSFLS